MKIVAFIAPKIEGIGIEYGLKNLLVQNCTSQPVAKRDAGIVDVTNTLETYEIGRYTIDGKYITCLLYTSPSPRDLSTSRMPSSA